MALTNSVPFPPIMDRWVQFVVQNWSLLDWASANRVVKCWEVEPFVRCNSAEHPCPQVSIFCAPTIRIWIDFATVGNQINFFRYISRGFTGATKPLGSRQPKSLMSFDTLVLLVGMSIYSWIMGLKAHFTKCTHFMTTYAGTIVAPIFVVSVSRQTIWTVFMTLLSCAVISLWSSNFCSHWQYPVYSL